MSSSSSSCSSAIYLGPLGLEKYVKVFDEEGFDDPELLDVMESLEDMTVSMKMNREDASTLWKYLSSKDIVSPMSNDKMKKQTSREYLSNLDLEQYVERFDEEGFEDITSLEGMSSRVLVKELKMKKGHARKLERYVTKTLSDMYDDAKPNATRFIVEDKERVFVKMSEPPPAPTQGCALFRVATEPTTDTKRSVDRIEGYMKEKHLTWHAFISHMQSEGGDAVMAIDAHFSRRGWSFWTDQSPNTDVTLEGMKRGIQQSAVYVLYCTKSVFTRPFVRLELIEAVRLQKPILVMYEADDRRAKFTFDSTTGVPSNFRPICKELLRNHNAISWERKPHLRKAVIDLVEQRIVEALTGTGIGLKTLHVSGGCLAAARDCWMGNGGEATTTTTTTTTSSLKTSLKSPSGHDLKLFATPRDGFGCDICKRRFSSGTVMYGCRLDNFDACENCFRKSSSAGPSKAVSTRSQATWS